MSKQGDIFHRWYVRYPLACCFLWAAWYLINANTKQNQFFLWMVILFAVGAAVYFARELSLVLVGIGVIYLLFTGIASLPVSVAIVVGAIIIALAIKK